MGSVVFDPTAFRLRFAEFASLSDALLNLYFGEASTLMLRNDDCSVVTDLTQRATLLNYAVAHLCALNAKNADGSLARDGVGRVNEARQGTVQVSLFMPSSESEMAAWYNQTPYGAAFWSMTSQFRTFDYVGPQAQQRFPVWMD